MRSLAENEWYLYQLKCQDGSHFASATRDLVKALVRHHQGQNNRTRMLLPVSLAFACICSMQEGELVLARLIRRPHTKLRGLPQPMDQHELVNIEREVRRLLGEHL